MRVAVCKLILVRQDKVLVLATQCPDEHCEKEFGDENSSNGVTSTSLVLFLYRTTTVHHVLFPVACVVVLLCNSNATATEVHQDSATHISSHHDVYRALEWISSTNM